MLIILENSIPSFCFPWKSCISVLYFLFDFIPLPRKIIWFSCICKEENLFLFRPCQGKYLLILYFPRKIFAYLVLPKENIFLSCISQEKYLLVLYFSRKIFAYLVFLKENLYLSRPRKIIAYLVLLKENLFLSCFSRGKCLLASIRYFKPFYFLFLGANGHRRNFFILELGAKWRYTFGMY